MFSDINAYFANEKICTLFLTTHFQKIPDIQTLRCIYFAVETYFKITYAIKSISGPVMLRRKNVREKIKYWVLLHMTNVGEKISRNNIIFVLNHKHYRIMYLKRYSDTQKALEIMLSYERFLFAVYGLSKYQSVDYRVALI